MGNIKLILILVFGLLALTASVSGATACCYQTTSETTTTTFCADVNDENACEAQAREGGPTAPWEFFANVTCGDYFQCFQEDEDGCRINYPDSEPLCVADCPDDTYCECAVPQQGADVITGCRLLTTCNPTGTRAAGGANEPCVPADGCATRENPDGAGVVCSCLDAYTGDSCDQCADGYWAAQDTVIGEKVCVACNCDATGSTSTICDKETGDCTCMFQFTGRRCDTCQEMFTGTNCADCADGYFPSGADAQTCSACDCIEDRALSDICDSSGKCKCETQFSGDKCQICAEGYTGDNCDQCQKGFWNRGTGESILCVACDCQLESTVDSICDVTNGQCQCQTSYTGPQCKACDYNVPVSDNVCLERRGEVSPSDGGSSNVTDQTWFAVTIALVALLVLGGIVYAVYRRRRRSVKDESDTNDTPSNGRTSGESANGGVAIAIPGEGDDSLEHGRTGDRHATLRTVASDNSNYSQLSMPSPGEKPMNGSANAYDVPFGDLDTEAREDVFVSHSRTFNGGKMARARHQAGSRSQPYLRSGIVLGAAGALAAAQSSRMRRTGSATRNSNGSPMSSNHSMGSFKPIPVQKGLSDPGDYDHPLHGPSYTTPEALAAMSPKGTSPMRQSAVGKHQHGSLGHVIDPEWELPRDRITIDEHLGSGAFGDVWQGRWMGFGYGDEPLPVAIKTLQQDSDDEKRIAFFEEAELMKRFSHPNIVQLFGVSTLVEPQMIVTELLEKGSLSDVLKTDSANLSVSRLMCMALEIAQGMSYLESQSFVHRDLAARNILVGEGYICKVADFGLSRVMEDDQYITRGGQIPVRWTAPEALKYRRFSSATDVWSFGVLLWEMYSYGERPYKDMRNEEVVAAIDSGYALPKPEGCPPVMHDLMLQCWRLDPDERPTFAELLSQLQQLVMQQKRAGVQIDTLQTESTRRRHEYMMLARRELLDYVARDGGYKTPRVGVPTEETNEYMEPTDSGIRVTANVSDVNSKLLDPDDYDNAADKSGTLGDENEMDTLHEDVVPDNDYRSLPTDDFPVP